MANNSAEYAVRIAEVKINKNEIPVTCLNISFGNGLHLPKGFNAVEVSIFPKKVMFKFFMTAVKRFVNDANSNTKKARLNKFGNCMRASFYGDEFINKISEFEGEYHIVCTNLDKTKADALNDCYTCWINAHDKEGFSNYYVNSSAVLTPKKSDEDLIEKEESETIVPLRDVLKVEEDIPLKPTTNYPETLREYAIQVLIERYTNSVKHKPERDLVRMLIEGRY